MNHSDQPIYSPSEDLLGRTAFASAIADAISQLEFKSEGYVIGLTGEWGSGKSSIINLICYYIRQHQIATLSTSRNFHGDCGSPYSPDDLDSLDHLFREIRHIFFEYENKGFDLTRADQHFVKTKIRGISSDPEQAANIYRYWRLSKIADESPNIVILNFSPWLIPERAELTTTFLQEIARSIRGRLDSDVEVALDTYLHRINEIAHLLTLGIDLTLGTPTNKIVSHISKLATKPHREFLQSATLDKIKRNLDNKLKDLNRKKILIIIDDLDRLAPKEAYEMTSLVKSLGNLPNVIYLLGYHERSLSNLISQAISIDGGNFLEKIIQYKKTLPLFELDQRERLFEHYFVQMIETLDLDDRDRLRHIWTFILTEYLTTPRDICRLANTYFFARAALVDFTDPIDLLVLETLNLFDPDVYELIRLQLIHLEDTV